MQCQKILFITLQNREWQRILVHSSGVFKGLRVQIMSPTVSEFQCHNILIIYIPFILSNNYILVSQHHPYCISLHSGVISSLSFLQILDLEEYMSQLKVIHVVGTKGKVVLFIISCFYSSYAKNKEHKYPSRITFKVCLSCFTIDSCGCQFNAFNDLIF